MNSKTPNTQSKKDVGAKVIEKVKQNDDKETTNTNDTKQMKLITKNPNTKSKK